MIYQLLSWISNAISLPLRYDSLSIKCWSRWSKTGNIEDPTPEIVFKFPSFLPCTVFYESPRSLDICIATEVSLKPYEQKWTSFVLSCAAPVIRTDIILITSRTWDTVNVVPSRTRISLVSPSQRYYGNALVANTSNEYVENLVIYAR